MTQDKKIKCFCKLHCNFQSLWDGCPKGDPEVSHHHLSDANCNFEAKTFQRPDFLCSSYVLPVGVGSNLVDHWLGSFEDLVHIGDIEEEILHVDGRGRGFPWLEHATALDQNNLLLIHKVNMSV